jgi:hypothetical protein
MRPTPAERKATWVRWLVIPYLWLGVVVLGCVLMAVGVLEGVGAYLAVFALICFGVARLMWPSLDD